MALAVGWQWLGGVFFLFVLTFAWFFRDPERRVPDGAGLVVSPADGRVVEVVRAKEGETIQGAAKRVSIFLSPLDVHINRAPVEGRVGEVSYQPGRFFAAFREQASSLNERNVVRLESPDGRGFGVVQIAGVLARRIICHVNEGEKLERGQRLGLIMFGSRVDLYLPEEAEVEVNLGDRVKGGKTVIARVP